MILPFIHPGAKILDVGCDDAALLEHVPGFEFYLGLDSRESVISRNRQRGEPGNVSFVCSKFDRFEWPGSPFNLVVMTAVVEHLDDLGIALFRLKPLLAERGLILITTPAPVSRFVLQAGAVFRLFARESLREHKNYFRKKDFQSLPDWELSTYKRFECGLNQLVVLRQRNSKSA